MGALAPLMAIGSAVHGGMKGGGGSGAPAPPPVPPVDPTKNQMAGGGMGWGPPNPMMNNPMQANPVAAAGSQPPPGQAGLLAGGNANAAMQAATAGRPAAVTSPSGGLLGGQGMTAQSGPASQLSPQAIQMFLKSLGGAAG